MALLQENADASFQPPKSIELHPRFIALNAAIKTARELDASRSYYGALYQYLEAVRQYGMLDQAPLDEAAKVRVKQELAAAKGDSMARLFVERALGWTESGQPDEWRGAQMILAQVLPAYAAALKGAPAVPRKTGKTVEITLVRWPYT